MKHSIPLYSAVFLVAAWLRAWRLSWGLEDGMFFPDELYWGVRGQAFANLAPHWLIPGDLVYPPLYGYLTGVASRLASAFGLLGPVPTQGLALDVILAARGLSVVVGVATVALVGALGSRLYSPRVGLTAAALLAVAPLHAMQVHYASVDVLLTAGFTLTALAAYSVAERGAVPSAAVAGVCAGLAFATKYVGLAALATVVILVVGRSVRERSARSGVLLGLGALGGFTAAVIVACPPCVLRPDLLAGAVSYLDEAIANSLLLNNRLAPTLGWYARPYLYQVVASLPFSMGWPAACLVLTGVWVAIRRRTSADLVLLAMIAPYFLAMGWRDVTFPRYLLPLFPALVVLAARAVFVLPRAPWARGALLAGIIVYSAALTVSQTKRFSYDQQDDAARWIAAKAPVGREGASTRVAVPETLSIYYRLKEPMRRAGLTYVTVKDGHWFDDDPEIFVLPKWYEIAIDRDRHSEAAARDLKKLRSGEASYREARRWRSSYLQQGFYTWLDPAFAADLWQGEIGFTLYVRTRS